MMTASTDLAAQKPLTLEHLLGGGNQYHQMVPENKHLTWWGNTALETRAEEVADADGGKVLFSIEDLNQWAGKKIAYSGHNTRFPYEGEPLVLVTGARERTLIDFTRHTVEWTQSIPEGAANQDWNPQSRNLAYTVKGNLYVQTADGKTLQVTTDGSTDGSDNIVYGTSVHRNEWGIEKGTFWSPDGKKLAFYRMDQSMVPSYPQVDITTRIATTYTDHYPMAGERSHEVKVGIYDVEAGTTTWMDLVGEKEDYHTNLSWAPDGKTLYVFELNRRQNHMRLMAYDTATGQPLRELLSEKDDKYVEPMHELAFLPWDEGKAIMQSQRDGYNHLYVLDVNSGLARQLTRGPWVVQQMVGFNTRQKSVIYRSNERDPRYSCLYAVSVKTGKTIPLGRPGRSAQRHLQRRRQQGHRLVEQSLGAPERKPGRDGQGESREPPHGRRPLEGTGFQHPRDYQRLHQGRRRSDRPVLQDGTARRVRFHQKIPRRGVCIRRSSCPQRTGILALGNARMGSLHGTVGLCALHPGQPGQRMARTGL